MSIEHRLTEALHVLDQVEPSPDLFARMGRSVQEDKASRRRRAFFAIATLLLGAGVTGWITLSASVTATGQWRIDGWRLVVAYLALAAGVIVAMAPNIRRFGEAFVEEVFHLSPQTGRHFATALDISYYVLFTGIALVDADVWRLDDSVRLAPAAEQFAGRLAFLLLVMGVLHAVNIALLPVLGLIFNSIARAAARRVAGSSAPEESWQARRADAIAHGFAVGLAVLALSIVVSIFLGGPGTLLVWGG